MKSIAMKDEDGKYCGLIVRPEEGTKLSNQELIKLYPYIEHVIRNNKDFGEAIKEKILQKLIIVDDKLSLTELSEVDRQNISDLFDVIVTSCNNCIKEQLIVPQAMGAGPTIRHRVFSFEPSELNESLSIKYTELGSFNNFEEALKNLSLIYPSVVPHVDDNAEEEERIGLACFGL